MDLRSERATGRAAWRAVADQLALRRRLVVAVLTGIAVVAALSALRPTPVATVAIWVAAHDLAGGAPLAAGDIEVERIPRGDVPSAALRPGSTVVGRLLAAPVSRGEPLTAVRLLSTALLRAGAPPGETAVPVRVADGPATVALVHAGDLVDVIAAADPADGGPATAETVAHDVPVLVTPTRETGSDDTGDQAGLLIVAADARQAAALADAGGAARLTVAVDLSR